MARLDQLLQGSLAELGQIRAGLGQLWNGCGQIWLRSACVPRGACGGGVLLLRGLGPDPHGLRDARWRRGGAPPASSLVWTRRVNEASADPAAAAVQMPLRRLRLAALVALSVICVKTLSRRQLRLVMPQPGSPPERAEGARDLRASSGRKPRRVRWDVQFGLQSSQCRLLCAIVVQLDLALASKHAGVRCLFHFLRDLFGVKRRVNRQSGAEGARE